jgi:predicted ribosome quality control (RQC) complex YloA/Tae2 family protein
MIRVTLDLRSSVEENAERYFEAAKRARRKAKGAEQAIAAWRLKLDGKEATEPPRAAPTRPRRREWYEKFRWCRSSDGLLMVAGRDAATNELLIKRHTQTGDIVFHTDLAGSPFVVVKAGSDVPSPAAMEEAAQLCASYGRAWKNGLTSLEVFHVSPEQVTKEAQPGEFLSRGAFMVRGKMTYHKPLLKVAVGIDGEGRVMAGPPVAVMAHCPAAYELLQGNEKASSVAKQLQRFLGGNLDELVAALPPGGCRLGKRQK